MSHDQVRETTVKKPNIKRDDGKFYVETENGQLSGYDADALAELVIKMDQNQDRAEEFLAAWKDGVVLAGEHYFRVRSDTVESATDKNDLRPNLDVITESHGVISPGERVFILSLYQFFSDSTIVDLCVEKEIQFPTLVDIGTLDIERRNVIARLLATYHGW